MRKQDTTNATQTVFIAGRARRPNESLKNAVICAIAGIALWGLYAWAQTWPAP